MIGIARVAALSLLAMMAMGAAQAEDALKAKVGVRELGAAGAGFVARPLGSVLFGHIGDRRGRRPVLLASLVLTGTATVAAPSS